MSLPGSVRKSKCIQVMNNGQFSSKSILTVKNLDFLLCLQKKIQNLKVFKVIQLNNSFLFCSSHIFVFWFWYFGQFSCVMLFLLFLCLANLALQYVDKDYVIFSYFRNFVTKSDQKPKTKNGMNETFKTYS